VNPNVKRRPGGDHPGTPRENITCSEDTTTRCGCCSRPLTDPRSVAVGLGPVCAARLAGAQLDDRRQAVGGHLAALDARLAGLDVRGLAIVLAGLQDVMDALDAEEVAS
jgi:Family of unknown function (DUF6011)